MSIYINSDSFLFSIEETGRDECPSLELFLNMDQPFSAIETAIESSKCTPMLQEIMKTPLA